MTEQEKDTAANETGNATKDAKPTAAPKTPAATTRTRHSVRNLLLILLLVIAASGAGGYYGVIFLQKQSARMDALASLQSQLQDQNTQIKSHLDDSLQALNKQQQGLANDIEVMRNRSHYLQKDWLIMEAEYLVQLANNRLLFERDVNTAIVALQAADDRLRETGDPGLINIRKVINDSVQALKAVPQPDLAGMSMTMSAIAKSISDLPLNTPEPKPHAQTPVAGKIRKVKSWSELPAAIWQDLKSLIVIRNHAKPVEPLLAPSQRFFLVENLRLQIEQARLAMLSGHAGIYSERLATAVGWIKKYFDTDAVQTKAVLSTLKQLQASNIAPALPDISKSYELLVQYQHNQHDNAKGK